MNAPPPPRHYTPQAARAEAHAICRLVAPWSGTIIEQFDVARVVVRCRHGLVRSITVRPGSEDKAAKPAATRLPHR